MQWPQLTVDALKANERYSLVGGPFGSNLTVRDYVDVGVPVIRGGNLPHGLKFFDDDFVYVKEEKADTLTANLAYPGDVIFTQRGTLGQIGIVPRTSKFSRYVVSQSQMKLSVNTSKVSSEFIYYYFCQASTVQYIRNHALTSGVPHINLGILKSMRISLPPVPVQQRIVEILRTYDDLIDNNRRRIQLLENSVRLLFDEWFVKLQVPKDAGLSNAVADQIQWTSCTLGDLCLEVKTSVLPTELDPDMPYIGLEHLPRRSITLCDWGQASEVSSLKSRFTAGDIIFGKIRPYFHKVGVALTDGVCSSDTIVIRAQQQEWYPFLVALLSSDPFIASTSQAMKEGTKMPRADWKQMKAYPVRLPELKVAARFGAVVQPVLAQLKTLALQSRQLHLARDLLLPRLMSGEIEV